MGTKSKSREPKGAVGRKKTGGLFAAILLIFAADAVFLSQYPVFQERAATEEPDILSGSEFLHEIYQANIVLYKQLQEQTAGRDLAYQEVYLSASQSAAENVNEYFDFGDSTPLSYAGETLDNLLSEWELTFSEGLAAQTDYRIIACDTQDFTANTERDLTALGEADAGESLNEAYPYYIKMYFNEDGVLSHVWARSGDADGLLKSIQRVMQSRYLERSLYESLSYSAYSGVNWEDEITYGNDTGLKQMRLHVTNLPKNCVICYAITEAQLSQIKASSPLFPSAQTAGNYYNSGIQQFFAVILVLLGLAAVLLPLWKGYHLHECFLLPLHIESAVFLLLTAFLVLGELAAGMVRCTMSKQWAFSLSYAIQSVLPGIPSPIADGIVFVLNLLFLTAAFSLWYVLATFFCQAYVLGLRTYFRKRWLGLRIYRRLRIAIRRKKLRFVRELQHLDPEEDIRAPLLKLLSVNYLILAFLSLFWVFGIFLLAVYSVFLYACLKKYIGFIQEKYACMLSSVRSIAGGNLQTAFTDDWGMFESCKGELNRIQAGFSRAVEEEVKSQRMRTELITNVSHDLKTPLTAIITYIDLLQEEGVTDEQREEYLEVLERKSLRLKALIEDLFEVSKASSGNVTFHKEKVDIGNLVRQVYLEYEDRAKEAELLFRFAIPDQKLFLMLDGEKTCRIFDNLYTNILKYAMPQTRVYVTVQKRGDEVCIELKNISGSELNVAPESLTERFVRGDSARSSEGSGLGLAIARSFVELQGGRMEISVDGDLFKVTLFFIE